MLTWRLSLDREALVADEHEVVEFSSVCPEVVVPGGRRAGSVRILDLPLHARRPDAAKWIDAYRRWRR